MRPILSGRKVIERDNAVEQLAPPLPCREVHLQAMPQNVEDIAVGTDPNVEVPIPGAQGRRHDHNLSALQDRPNDVFPAGIVLAKREPYVIQCSDISEIYVSGNINDGVTFVVYR